MNLQTTLETVSQYLPDGFQNVLDVQPSEIDFTQAMIFLGLFAGCALVLSLLGRWILGKRSSLNHSVSSAMGILFLYAASMILYTFKPLDALEQLSPLPFMVFAGDYMMVISFQYGAFSVLCHEILSLIMLAFLMNLLDTIFPKGKSLVVWYVFRVLTMAGAMALHILADWALDTYLPEVLVTYAPVLLLIILASTMFLGALNFLLGLLLAVFDPILGALYTFFFSNIIGKQLTKAVVSTIILCVVFFFLGHYGYTMICVTEDALITYIPFGLVMLVLWYLIGHSL